MGLLNSTSVILSMMDEEEEIQKEGSIVIKPILNEGSAFKELKDLTDEDLFFKVYEENDGSLKRKTVYLVLKKRFNKLTLTKITIKNLVKSVEVKVEDFVHIKANKLPNITKHALYAKEIGAGYDLYVATADHKVYRIRVDTVASDSFTYTELFKHNKPIVHMSFISHLNSDYLVTGSTYPSIKIHKIKDNGDNAPSAELINTLHNRFLLGCAGERIVYAKKDKRPFTGLGRWVEAQTSQDEFDCTIFSVGILQGRENETNVTFDEKHKSDASLSLNRADYPVITETNDAVTLYDKKSSCVYQCKHLQNPDNVHLKYFYINSQKEKKPNPESEINQLTQDEYKAKLTELMKKKDFISYLKSFINMAEYNDFLLELPGPNKGYLFFCHILAKAFEGILIDEKFNLKDQSAKHFQESNTREVELSSVSNTSENKSENVQFNQTLWKAEQIPFLRTLAGRLNSACSGINLEEIDNNKLAAMKNCIQDNFFDDNFEYLQWNQVFSGDQSTSTYPLILPFPTFPPALTFSKIYEYGTLILLSANNEIFGVRTDLELQEFSKISIDNNKKIEYVFEHANEYLLLIGGSLYKLEVSVWQNEVKKAIKEQQDKYRMLESQAKEEKKKSDETSKIDNLKLDIIKKIIEAIMSDDTINKLKDDIEQATQFIVAKIDDIPSPSTRLSGEVLDILVGLFIKQIVRTIIKDIVQNSLEELNLYGANISKLIERLATAFSSYNIWCFNMIDYLDFSLFEGKKDPILSRSNYSNFKISQSQVAFIAKIKGDPAYKNLKNRFGQKLLDDLADAFTKQDKSIFSYETYLYKIAILSLALGYETVEIESFDKEDKKPLKNSTFFNYAKPILKENADNIKNYFSDADRLNTLYEKVYKAAFGNIE